MLPSQTQRVLMLVAVLLGLPALIAAAHGLAPADGLGGWALTDLPGPWAAAGWLSAGAVPALILAALLAATGNPLTGILTLGTTFLLAVSTGSAAGTLRRAGAATDGGSGAGLALCLRLAAETLTWAVAVAAVWALLTATQRALRPRLPRRLQTDHAAAAARGKTTPSGGGAGTRLGALVATAAVGGAITWMLARNDSAGQAVGAVVVAFAIAPLVGQSVSPSRSPLPALLAPALAGVAGYVYLGLTLGRTSGALQRALYDGTLPGVGRVLPVQYAVAGAVGASIGLGLWQMTVWTRGQLR